MSEPRESHDKGPGERAPLVLYVDDEPSNLTVFKMALRNQFRIQVASSGEDALELLHTTQVAVVVTDMRMRGISGEELLRAFKEQSPQTIRMVITAYADIDPILRAINEGLVARYIIKPWNLAELRQVLRWATEAWQFGKSSSALSRRLLETERLTTLGTITTAIAHDLKQPLAALSIDAKHLERLLLVAPLIRRLLDGETLSKAEAADVEHSLRDLTEIAPDIRTSVKHVQSVVHSLTEVFHQSTPSVSTADPLLVVRHALSVCQDLALRAHASIESPVQESLPNVKIAAGALTQVLINVITNGLDAIAAKDAPGGTVKVAASASDKMLVLEIHDDGIGMPASVLSRVGTPFFTTRENHTGIGVAQCQRLIGAAGGRFQIASSQKTGTTVTITLPLSPQVQAES